MTTRLWQQLDHMCGLCIIWSYTVQYTILPTYQSRHWSAWSETKAGRVSRPGKSYKAPSSEKFRALQSPQNSWQRINRKSFIKCLCGMLESSNLDWLSSIYSPNFKFSILLPQISFMAGGAVVSAPLSEGRESRSRDWRYRDSRSRLGWKFLG